MQPYRKEGEVSTLSAIDFAVISQAIQAAAQEAGLKLVRAAHSTILREAQDGSAALLDRHGNVIALAELIPIQLGTMGVTLRACLARCGIDELKEGDFLINNDPYEGGQHLQDIFIFTPIFIDGKVIGFGGSVAHHLDIGGGMAGLNMGATEVFQEGLRIPPARFSLDRDWNGGSLERLFAANFRVPNETIGDMNAQFAANNVAAVRVKELAAKYGVDKVLACMDRMLDYSEERVRHAIRAVPNGVYYGEEAIEGDRDGELIHIKAKLTVNDDDVVVDLTGSSPQLRSNINAPFASSLSAVLSCIKMVLTGPDVAFNEGAIRPVSVVAPLGTIVNPRFPTAVRARMTTANRVYGAIKQAFAHAVPDSASAQGFETTTVLVLAKRKAEGFSIFIEPHGGGFGATVKSDGCGAVDPPLTNCTNTPAEALDENFDFFRVIESRLVENFGHGRYRGGWGYLRRYRILSDDVEFAMYSDRFRRPARGVGGGTDGGLGYCTVYRANGDRVALAARTQLTLNTGDEIELVLGGGGGVGDPRSRRPELVRQDLADSLFPPEVARDVYGHQLTP
jgi:N-methylhydantoinase B